MSFSQIMRCAGSGPVINSVMIQNILSFFHDGQWDKQTACKLQRSIKILQGSPDFSLI